MLRKGKEGQDVTGREGKGVAGRGGRGRKAGRVLCVDHPLWKRAFGSPFVLCKIQYSVLKGYQIFEKWIIKVCVI